MGRFASLFNFLLNLTILVGYIYKSHKITLMKLNTKSRYAVMALADLAKFSSQNPVSLRDISLRQNISILYLEQIFLKLKKNNVVRSVRGINGGYVLNKNPEDIKIAEIFLALDGSPTNKSTSVGLKYLLSTEKISLPMSRLYFLFEQDFTKPFSLRPLPLNSISIPT